MSSETIKGQRIKEESHTILSPNLSSLGLGGLWLEFSYTCEDPMIILNLAINLPFLIVDLQ